MGVMASKITGNSTLLGNSFRLKAKKSSKIRFGGSLWGKSSDGRWIPPKVPWFTYQGVIIMAHYDDVILGAMASQITILTIVYSTVYSDQRKHQSSASLAFVRGIHRGPVNSPHKWPVTRKMSPFDDVIMRPAQHTAPSTPNCYARQYALINSNQLEQSALTNAHLEVDPTPECYKESSYIYTFHLINKYIGDKCNWLSMKKSRVLFRGEIYVYFWKIIH